MDTKTKFPFALAGGQTLLFVWRMCLFFSPIVLASSGDPSSFLVAGRLSYLVVCALGLSALVMLERSRPSLFAGRFPVLLGTACAVGGSALVVFGSSAGSASMVAALCGFVAIGVGDALISLSFGRFYGGLSVKLSMRVVPFAVACAALIYAVVVNGVPGAAGPLVVGFPLGCGAALLYDLAWARRVRGADETDAADRRPAPFEAEGDSGKTRFTKWRISSYTAILWFSFGVMWSLAVARMFGDQGLFSMFSLSVAAIVIIAALVVAGLTYVLKLPTAKTFWIFVPLTVAGISVVAVVDSNVQVFAFAMVFAARSIAEMQLITHFAAICRRRGHRSTILFGCGFAILSLGEAVGLVVGALVASIESTELTMLLLVCANVIVIVVILSIMRVNSTFQKMELAAALARRDGDEPDAAAGAYAPSTGDVARAWAQRFGLSAREEEVAGLLLAGRNVPAIAEMLFISQSTVHTHVKHIYEKTGVHTRQELIDLRDDSLEKAVYQAK